MFGTESSFRAARGGTVWLNALLKRFGIGRWCVTVDVDELLYYPGIETAGLARLTSYLDQKGSEAMSCLLLDLYPDGPIRDSAYGIGDDLVSAAPFFDAGPYERLSHTECPPVLIYGGVRERVFSGVAGARLAAAVARDTVSPRAPQASSRSTLGVGSRQEASFPPLPHEGSARSVGRAFAYLNVNHFVSPKKLATETGVLLHFKLLQDFHIRASQKSHAASITTVRSNSAATCKSCTKNLNSTSARKGRCNWSVVRSLTIWG